MMNALLSWHRCVDYDARVEVQLMALYRQMREDFYSRALGVIGMAVGLRTDATTVVMFFGNIFYLLCFGETHSTTNMRPFTCLTVFRDLKVLKILPVTIVMYQFMTIVDSATSPFGAG